MKEKRSKSLVLAKYDISGIQRYIFATNRLRENVGASYLVGKILKEYLPEIIKGTLQEKGNVLTEWQGQEFQMGADHEVVAEVIYIGGGNALVAFQNEADFVEVSQKLALRIELESAGLFLAAAAVRTDLTDFVKDNEILNHKMAEAKKRWERPVLCSHFPIVEQDASYGLPITERINYGDTYDNVSTVQFQKREAFDKGEKDIWAKQNLPAHLAYAVEMEDLCQKGEDGYVAVIHIDGNGIGNIINRQMQSADKYDKAVLEVRKLSAKLSGLNDDVYGSMIKPLLSQSNRILPIRPILQDGDDLTFICKASYGLPLVIRYLRQLLYIQESYQLSSPITACAGIAYVHSHFPFRLAYQLAEECCSNAKKSWYENGESAETGYLDFQIARNSCVTQLSKLREVYPSDGEKQWILRPYQVAKERTMKNARSIDRLLGVLGRLVVKDVENELIWPNSRLKRLYEAYMQGETALELVDAEFISRGYLMSELANEPMSGGFNKAGKTILLDGLELMDFYDSEIIKNLLGSSKGGGV